MKHIVTPLLLIAAGLASGQDTLTLYRQDFIDKVVRQSYTKRISDKEAEMARADYQQSNALFLPSVSASYSAMTTNNPLMAFGSRLNQEILTQADFDPALLNDPDRIDNFALEVRVMQPLLNLDGLYGRRAAKSRQEAMELQSGRTVEYLEFEAARLYMQLQLAYQQVEVLERALSTGRSAEKLVSDYLDQGLVQRADLLDARVRANEIASQLQYAKSQVRSTSDQLLVLMGGELTSAVLRPAEEATTELMPEETPGSLPANRKDLAAMDRAVKGYQELHRSSAMKFLPRINAFGSYQVYDGEFMEFDASGYLLGAQLSWDVFKGYAQLAQSNKSRLELEKARIELDEYRVRQETELSQTRRMLAVAEENVALTRLALEQATESHRIRRDRFEQGLEKTVDLLAAETTLYQKELQLAQAVYEYRFTQEYLHFLTRE